MSDINKPWLANYSSGVPSNIDPDKFKTLVSIIEFNLERFADNVAFSNFGKELKYKDIDKYSRQFGAYLQSRGLVAGDKIALMMPNLLQYPIALFGALRAGLVVVNTNPLYTEREMHHQFTDAGVKAVVIAENFADKLQDILHETDINCVITTKIGDLLGGKGKLINFALKHVKRQIPKFNIANAVSFKDALSEGKKFTITTKEGNADDTVLLQYTGGTTGVAKGAMLTNRNIIANMLQIHAIMAPVLEVNKEVILSPLPMYHIFCFTVNILAMMHIGATNVLVTNPRDLNSVIKEFKRYPVGVTTGVNTLFNALLNHKDFADLDFSSLKVTVAGGMALQRSVGEKWQQVTGCFLAEGYGMTESSPVASVNPIDKGGRLGTIGLPIPSTDLRIVDDAGNALSVGEVGEIQIRGPQVMKGYYNRPEATAKVINEEGWLSTGDIGKMYEDGFFQIVDRKKDMILVSGFNVYPNEVEDVIASHPKVLEVAAIGIPNEKSGEVVKVFIVKGDKSLTDKEVIAHCKENLTGYKVPKQVEFRKELPKTNVGKILRKDLRKEEEAKRNK